MFLKPANSDTENGIKKILYSENSKTGKVKNKIYQGVKGWLPSFKKIFLYSFSFQNAPLLKRKRKKCIS